MNAPRSSGRIDKEEKSWLHSLEKCWSRTYSKTSIASRRHDSKTMAEAEKRCKQRETQLCQNMKEKIDGFYERYPFFANVYVINGMRKEDFVKRLLSQACYYPSHNSWNSHYADYLYEMSRIFRKCSNQRKSEILDEINCLCCKPRFMKEAVQGKSFKSIYLMLRRAFTTNDSRLTELGAFVAAHLCINLPKYSFRISESYKSIYGYLLHALKQSFTCIIDFTINLRKKRDIHLDEKLRGKTDSFAFHKYQSSIGKAHHRVSSILYYTLALMLENYFSSSLLNNTVKCAMGSGNPLQYILLKLLHNYLLHLDELVVLENANWPYPLNQDFFNLLSRKSLSEFPSVSDRTCLKLIDKCLILGRNIMLVTIANRGSGQKCLECKMPQQNDNTEHYIEDGDDESEDMDETTEERDTCFRYL